MLHRVIGLGLGGRVCFIFLRPLKRCSFLHTWATYQQQQLPNVSCNRKLFSAAKSPLASSTKVPSIHHVDGRTQGWLDMRDALIRSNRVKYTIASPRMGQDLKKSKEERERETARILSEDWSDFIDTVSSLGSPELADQLSGAYYMQGSPIEDYSAKSNRLSDSIPEFSKSQLIYLTRQLTQHWDQPKIQGSGLLQLLILNLDKVLCKCDDEMLSKDEQLHLALLIGSFQFLDNLVFPGQVLRSRLKSETNINSAQTEEIVLTLLVATCCKHDGLIAGEFNQISSVIEDKLLKNFDSLNHSELAVCYQGLKAISVSGGAKLGSKMETVYGFRM